MSLTTKLTLGFAFALALQIIQALLSGYYTAAALDAVSEVTTSVEADRLAQNILDQTNDCLQRLDSTDPEQWRREDCNVIQVYLTSIQGEIRTLRENAKLDADLTGVTQRLEATVAKGIEELDLLGACVSKGIGQAGSHEQIEEHEEFLADHLTQVRDAIYGLKIVLKAQIEAGLHREREYHDLPARASLLITLLAGVVLTVFTIWYSGQVARPIRKAHSELEARVQERTQNLKAALTRIEQDMEERERLHGQLLDASREAGQAEIATSVLHNVGNVLNSVNVSADLMRETLFDQKTEVLTKASDLLRSKADTGEAGTFLDEDARGRKFPDLLAELSIHIGRSNGSLREEIDSLMSNVDHIKQIVSAQQGYARSMGVDVALDIRKVIDEVRVISNITVPMLQDIEATPDLQGDKGRLMQILTNLLRNANSAVLQSGKPDGYIGIIARWRGDNLQIDVADNGTGIASDHLTKVLAHGFTTKADGHGFGLHYCANAAREMGGSLSARSDGEGLGATFTLIVPRQPPGAGKGEPMQLQAES